MPRVASSSCARTTVVAATRFREERSRGGETPASAAVREAREETGAEIELDHLIGSYGLDNGFLVHLFNGRVVAGEPELQPGGELSELRWLPPDLIPERRSNALRHGLPDALAGRRDVVRENLARR